MEAKDKAKELVQTFYDTGSHPHSVAMRELYAKKCALKCVEEMMPLAIAIDAIQYPFYEDDDVPQREYWQSVKKEIENI